MIHKSGVWPNWPPLLNESPSTISGGPAKLRAEELLATGNRHIGDWTFAKRKKSGEGFLVSMDGTVCLWKFGILGRSESIPSEESEGTMLVNVSRDGRTMEANWLTGGTDPDGMPAVLLDDWIATSGSNFETVVGRFHCGFATIWLRKWIDANAKTARSYDPYATECNWIGKDGKPLIPSDVAKDIQLTSNFSDGAAVAKFKDGDTSYRMIFNTEGRTVSDEHFYDAENFSCGWGVVTLPGFKVNYINKDGQFMSHECYSHASPFKPECGLAWVRSESKTKWNCIDVRNSAPGRPTYMLKRWIELDEAQPFDSGGRSKTKRCVAIVEKNGKYGFVDTKIRPICGIDNISVNGYYYAGGNWALIQKDRLSADIIDREGNRLIGGNNLTILSADNYIDSLSIRCKRKDGTNVYYLFGILDKDEGVIDGTGWEFVISRSDEFGIGRDLRMCKACDRTDGEENDAFVAWDAKGIFHGIFADGKNKTGGV